MNNVTNEQKAITILLIATAGFIVTFLQRDDGLIYGVINSACCAAMIGGLADWYAITALFNRIPLDNHSNILCRKRKDLTNAIVDFVTKDLLNTSNINDSIKNMEWSAFLVRYIEKYNGKEKVRRTVQSAAKSILSQIDLCTIVKKIEPDIRRSLRESSVELVVPKIGKRIVESEYSPLFFKTFLDLGKIMYNQPEFQGVLQEYIQRLGDKYDKKGFGRNTLRGMAFNDEDILQNLNDFINGRFDYWIANADCVYGEIRTEINELLQSQFIKELLLDKKDELLSDDDWMQWIYEKLSIYQKENYLEILNFIDGMLVKGLDKFTNDKEVQKKVDDWLKEQGAIVVEDNHSELGKMIHSKLDKQTDNEIVSMVREKAGDDIHSIRISGALIGGGVGLTLYLLGVFVEVVLR